MLSLTHSYLGELLMATGDAGAALEQRLAAWRIHQQLVRWDATNVTWERSLAISARGAGLGLADAGRDDEGLAALADSRDILLRLVDSDATSLDYRRELAKTESALAIAYLDEQPDEAVAAAHRSLEALAPLKATGVGDASLLSIESSAYLNLGRSLAAVGRIDEAREAWASALSLSRSSAATDGIDHLVILASTLLHLGRVDEARPIAHTLMQRGYRQPDFLTLARRNGLIATSGR
jgi:tetratricopeptide (TPR) repeat protein